jgi:flagellar hook-basal body complex protein FliE
METIPTTSSATISNLPIGTNRTTSLQPTPGSNSLFQHLLARSNSDQMASDVAIRDFIEQKPTSNIQQVVLAVAQAEMSFQFFMEVRNSLIDSYNELMRMQF